MLSHGGGIDGFTALVTFMPKDKIGMIILTNISGTPIPQIIAYNVYDRLLGLDQIPWNKRIKDEVAKAKEEAEKAKKDKDKDKKPDTKPSHPLEEYAGDFEYPGYGVVSFKKEGDDLKATFNSMSFSVKHYHYDIFELTDDSTGSTKLASFSTDIKGNVSSVSIQMEPAVKEIVFTRMPEKKMQERSFLEKFVGQYEISGIVITVSIKGENILTLTVPGQPEYELVPYKDTTFNFKNLTGFNVEFKLDSSGVVTEVVITQPNGVFTAKKK